MLSNYKRNGVDDEDDDFNEGLSGYVLTIISLSMSMVAEEVIPTNSTIYNNSFAL